MPQLPMRPPAAGVQLALAICLAAGCSPGVAPPESGSATRRPNVVLITLESLRVDRVGALGGRSRGRPERSPTPHIDALAAESVVYPDAHSVTSWTLASHASLFTGLYPTAHQTRLATDKLGDAYDTLAEILSRHGYQTAGVISGPYLRPAHNLNQGFASYDFAASSVDHEVAHADVTNPAMEAGIARFLEAERDPARPFFLFAYYWDPHYDFVPPPPYDTMYRGERAEEIDLLGFGTRDVVNARIRPAQLDYVLSQYEGEIGWTDASLGRLFASLKALGVWDDTIVVLTADHGEEFFEHGEKGHYNNLFAESVRVPLLIKHAKGGPRGSDPRLASGVDVLPTVLELAGIEAPAGLDGQSLVSTAAQPARPIFFELHAVWQRFDSAGDPERRETRTRSWLAVRRGDHKLVVQLEARRANLFDVRADPGEQRNLAQQEEGLALELLREIDAWQAAARAKAAGFEGGGTAELDAGERRRLEALGYLPE